MATVTRSTLTKQITPEEYTSYQNIAESFPPVFEHGKCLLAELAGKIQIMRLETEIFPSLTVEGNKDRIKTKEHEYCLIERQVAEFRATLQSINGQIHRAISLCGAVPASDIRFFELNCTATKVYDFCQRSLPTLNDWSLQGSLLDKRFELVMTKDYKHYNESLGNYKAAINPSSSFFGAFSSTLSSLFSKTEAAAEEPASPIKLEGKALGICLSYLAIDNALIEALPLQTFIKAFLDKISPQESSKYDSYIEQINFLKVVLSKINQQESFKHVLSADVETAILELQKQTSLCLVKHAQEKTPSALGSLLEDSAFLQAVAKIDAKLQGPKVTSSTLKASMQQLLDTQLESYSKPAKDPYKTDLLNQLMVLASKLR